MYHLTFVKPTAGDSFRGLPLEARLQFNETFDSLARHPTTSSADLDLHRLQGYRNVWTLRIPPWRAIYALDGHEIIVIMFGHRKDVYARLHGLLPPEGRYVGHHSFRRPRH